MDRLAECPEVAALIPPWDPDARVVYFPVRHHSPACAWHVSQLIRRVRPVSVLIEGPSDATPLLPFLLDARTKFPVAFYMTFVDRREADAAPARHSAYYPLADFSPEWAAIRAAVEVGAETRFIDLTYPEMVLAQRDRPDERVCSLLEEKHLRHSRLLTAACSRAGVRDPDELWDHLFEVDFQSVDEAAFIRNVLVYCALARLDYTEEMLTADGSLAREAAMAAAVTNAQARGRVVVVTGGFHTIALGTTPPKTAKPPKLAADDARVVLMRYSFEQLDRLNGYASGLPSPEYYQRLWDRREPANILVELARACRKQKMMISTADEIAALTHSRLLARFRGHPLLAREDLLDGVRSIFIKGSDDIEGVAVMAAARKLLAGDRIGDLPPDVGQPPIVDDFRRTAAQLKIDVGKLQSTEVVLDLYRKDRARGISRFFHRLAFLEIPFAEFLSGPDFVLGKDLERIRETWNYWWTPKTESALIERSLYGSSLEEAATAMLLERVQKAEAAGQGRRADVVAQLLVEACRMGLHRQTPELLEKTRSLVGEDSLFVSLVRAIEMLLVLQVSREPLEAHHLTGLGEVAGAAYDRACYLMPRLINTGEAEEADVLDALNALNQAVQPLGDTPDRRDLRWHNLTALADTAGGNATFRGAACGLLHGDGRLPMDNVVRCLQGHFLSAADDGREGPRFLRGLMSSARSVLWQSPEAVGSIHSVLRDWDEDRFIRQLPNLRLAFADLTPSECDRVGRLVVSRTGAPSKRLAAPSEFTLEQTLLAADINRRIIEALGRDQLEEFHA